MDIIERCCAGAEPDKFAQIGHILIGRFLIRTKTWMAHSPVTKTIEKESNVMAGYDAPAQ